MSLNRERANRRGLADQLRTLIRHAHELAEPMDAETFNRRPDGGGWSVAQCLEHLNATARLYLPVLTEAIEEARADGGVGSRREGRTLFGRLVTWSQEPPVRFRMKTHEQITPEVREEQTLLQPDVVLEEFEALHEELIVRINESNDMDRKKIRIQSVLDSRLKLSLGDWFAFLAAHGRRHLWQAEQVKSGIEGSRSKDRTIEGSKDRTIEGSKDR